jgi:hypothetical protein
MHLQKKAIPFITFFVVANPATFKMTRKVLGSWIAAADGLPTTAGLLLHALVFVLVAHFLWKLMKGPKQSSYRLSSQMGDDASPLAPRPGARAVQGSMDPMDTMSC